MTAEIAVFNDLAVALAADSAVTINGAKTYNSANKLFALSKYHPIGIMVYGSAKLNNTPWEALIKAYRKHLGKRSFPTVHEYAQDFFLHINSSLSPISASIKESCTQDALLNLHMKVSKDITDAISKLIEHKKKVTDQESLKEVEKTINQIMSSLDKHPLLPPITDEGYEAIKKEWLEASKEASKKTLPGLFDHLSAKAQTALACIPIKYICSDIYTVLGNSGVVFAGFGENEFKPVIESYMMESIYSFGPKVSYTREQSSSDPTNFRSGILAFAQTEVVYTFMTGVDQSINTFLLDFFDRFIRDYPAAIGKELLSAEIDQKEVRAKITEHTKHLLEVFKDEMQQVQKKNFVDPIIDMVRILPMDELAAMAESLVNLTAFKRRVTGNVETVGGPIDVAVISKGDGFIWVKRKHYFKPELNPNFFANYHRELP